jgi:hypothetical protein
MEYRIYKNDRKKNDINKYVCKKKSLISNLQAVVRAALTAIDYNSNVGRKLATDKDGEARYNVVNSRDGQVIK